MASVNQIAPAEDPPNPKPETLNPKPQTLNPKPYLHPPKKPQHQAQDLQVGVLSKAAGDASGRGPGLNANPVNSEGLGFRA